MIEIAISQMIPESLTALAGSVMESLLDDVAEMARAKWMALARTELTSSREAYLNAIQPIEGSEGERTIRLVGWLANAVEQGIEGFDLRDTLLGPRSRLRHVAADGSAYGRVPFRHAGPGGAGLHGQPMGRQYGPTAEHSRGLGGLMSAEQARSMGENIYRAAKALDQTTSFQGGKTLHGTAWGGRLPAGLAPKLAEHHVTDIFAGMVRVRHTYQKATQTQYMTWRTISERITRGWYHPGITARNLAERVRDHVEDRLPKIIRAAVSGALKGQTR